METCKTCHGSGGVPCSNLHSAYQCSTCKGTGIKPEQKPFDITKHKFSDRDVDGAFICGDGDLNIYYVGQDAIRCHNKADAIAIAKALGVTGDDLS